MAADNPVCLVVFFLSQIFSAPHSHLTSSEVKTQFCQSPPFSGKLGNHLTVPHTVHEHVKALESYCYGDVLV